MINASIKFRAGFYGCGVNSSLDENNFAARNLEPAIFTSKLVLFLQYPHGKVIAADYGCLSKLGIEKAFQLILYMLDYLRFSWSSVLLLILHIGLVAFSKIKGDSLEF
jgi:hypothetical protein